MTSTSTIPQTFTKADATAAYTLLQVRYRLDKRWIDALARGWENLNYRRCQWDTATQTLLIQSTTKPSARYTVTDAGCECYAASKGQVCDHVTAWWLCSEADRIHRKEPPKPRPVYQDINAAALELF